MSRLRPPRTTDSRPCGRSPGVRAVIDEVNLGTYNNSLAVPQSNCERLRESCSPYGAVFLPRSLKTGLYETQTFRCGVAVYPAIRSLLREREKSWTAPLNSNPVLAVTSVEVEDISQDLTGEFDPGSERTLAARLTHASRTRKGRACSSPVKWRTGE